MGTVNRWITSALCLGLLATSGWAAEFTVGAGDSIQDAVDAASEGDTIFIKGMHRESVFVEKTLHFVGKAGVMDGIGLSAPFFEIDFGVEGCTFTKLTFRFLEDAGEGEAPAIYLTGGNDGTAVTSSTFKACSVGIGIDSFSTGVAVTLCRFLGNEWDVVGSAENLHCDGNSHSRSDEASVELFGSGLIENSSFDLVEQPVYFSNNGSELPFAMQNCRVLRSSSGPYLSFAPGALVDNVDGRRISESFLTVFGGGVTVQNCDLVAVGGDGIQVYGSGGTEILVDANTLRKTARSVRVDGSGAITNNRISNSDAGVDASFGTWEIGGNILSDLTDSGIALLFAGGSEIFTNRLSGVSGGDADAAISIFLSSQTKVFENLIGDVDDGAGIRSEGSNNVQIFYNTIKSTRDSGIELNGSYGYLQATYNSVGYNTVTGCGDADGGGIVAHYQTGAGIAGNTVTRSGGIGILLEGTDGSLVLQNTVIGSERDGIWVRQAFDPEDTPNVIALNFLKGSGAEGIQNSACHFEGTIIAGNIIRQSTFQDIANEGNVDEEESVGNVNHKGVSIDPADWFDILPEERPDGECFESPQ